MSDSPVSMHHFKSEARPLHRRALLHLAAGSLAVQALGAPQRSASRIDVHHHVPPGPVEARPGVPAWTPQIAVEEMDRNGVATAIGSTGPLPASAGVEQARKLAREYNDYGARIGTDHPGRFGLFAVLPMNDVDGSLKEIEYAAETLRCDGFSLFTSYGDLWLGDAHFRPIFEELNRRGAVVYVHPADAPCCTPATLTYEKNGLSGPWIEWPMNTARTILSVLLAGYTHDLSKLRFIFSHGGGVMPLLIGRIEGFTEWGAVGPEKLRQLFPEGLTAEFRNFYFECAQAFDPVNFQAVRKLAPDTHLLFGTDYNRFPIAHSVRLMENLKLPANLRRAVERGNAERLFPRWKA